MQFIESKIQKDLNLLDRYKKISVRVLGSVLYQKYNYKEHITIITL